MLSKGSPPRPPDKVTPRHTLRSMVVPKVGEGSHPVGQLSPCHSWRILAVFVLLDFNWPYIVSGSLTTFGPKLVPRFSRRPLQLGRSDARPASLAPTLCSRRIPRCTDGAVSTRPKRCYSSPGFNSCRARAASRLAPSSAKMAAARSRWLRSPMWRPISRYVRPRSYRAPDSSASATLRCHDS